jgi:hypothetical protein
MESKIPLPTDNIYKFYALFGLMLLITSIAAVIYIQQTTNAFLFEAYVEIEQLSSIEHPSPIEATKKELLQKRIDISIADKKFFTQALSILLGIALVVIVAGFWQWHFEVQPKLDRLLDLQIQKAERDLKEPPREPFKVRRK